MLKIDINVQGLSKLQKHIEFVEKIMKMKTDKSFQKFIQDKVLETVKKVSNERLVGGTTDDEYIEEYKSRHKIREVENGFVLYNDTVLPTSMLPISPNTAMNYPNGFSIALAFEYGIGIIGENDAKVGAWNYNVNDWNFAWHYTKNGTTYSTYGYSGFEIYRYTAIEIENKLKDWVNEYYEKEVQ